jgi:hypothetical protein
MAKGEWSREVPGQWSSAVGPRKRCFGDARVKEIDPVSVRPAAHANTENNKQNCVGRCHLFCPERQRLLQLS